MKKSIFLIVMMTVLGMTVDFPLMADEQHCESANAQFLAEHPAVAKIAHRGAVATVPARDMSVNKSPKWSKPQRGPENAVLPEIWGNVVGADSWTGRYSAYGAYEFNPCENFTLNLLHSATSENMQGNGGAVKIGNKYHLTYWYMGMGSIMSKYFVWNTDTWTLDKQVTTNNGGLCATDLAYDRINNICYGAFFTDNQDGWELATIDFSGDIPVKTSIGRIPLMVAALGVNKAGEIYGICEDGVLYKFNKENAEYTRIGDTGIKVAGYSGVLQQTGEFDQHSDIFYWAAADAYGRSVLYTVNVNTAEVTKITDIPDRAQILNMQIMAPRAEDKAPGLIEDLKVEFTGGSLSGTVSFTVPSYTYDGDDLTSVTYYISANGEVLASERVAAGSTVSKEITVESGDCKLDVWVENSVGASPTAGEAFWAGPDVPVMKNVDYVKNGNTSEISWAVNETGSHNGWVGDLSFKVVRMPDGYVVTENTRDYSITDIIPENAPLRLYTYEVTPSNSDLKGMSMVSNGNVVGNAVEPPYSEDFEEGNIDLMEVLNNNKDKYTWFWDTNSYDSSNGVAKVSTGEDYSDSDFDDWMLTPEISLKAGRSYELTFKARCTEYYNDMFLRVMFGEGLDVSKYQELIPKTNMAYKSTFKEYTATITPTKDQNIRIGFQCTSDYASGSMIIDDIRLSQGVLPEAPGAVTNLEIVPDVNGKLQAKVKFTAPTVNHGGEALTSLSKIDVYTDNTLSGSINTPMPGAELSMDVNVSADGTHTFRVETFNDNGAGDALSTSAFVGVDVPGTFSAWLEEQGDKIAIKWNAPTVGENGKYINPDELTYNIYSSDGSMVGDLLMSNVTGTSFSFVPTPGLDEGDQGMLIYALRAVNRAGQSRGVSTTPLIVGKPYELPIIENFDGSASYYYDGDTNVDFNTAQGDSSDGDGTCFVWYYAGNNHNAYKELRTLKLGTKGAEKLHMTFDYKITGGGKFEIYVIKPNGTQSLAGTFSEQSYDGTWSNAKIDLSEFSNERYTRIVMRYVAGDDTYGIMYIDNVCIQNAVEKDMSVDLSVPTTPVRYGQFAQFITQVSNNGLQKASGYKIAVYVDGEKIEEKTGNDLEYMAKDRHIFQYEVRPGAPEHMNVQAEIIFDGDENPENNVVTKQLTVGMPKVSAPENLTVTQQDGNLLSWSAPSEFYTEEIVEDFESYSPWTITNMGEWQLYDGDKANVIGLGDADYPNEGAPQAFTIFNPSSIGVPANNVEANPHSGNQYAACFAAKVSPTMERNDDWLISTLLPGTSQTISFYAKQMIPDYGDEIVEVLYSQEGKEPEDFVKVEEFKISNYNNWKKFEAELPEGALYFAFHVITRDGHLFMLDDVNFIAGSCKEIVSWNVYRDGEFLVEVPADKTVYTDIDTNNHRYNVTAVYATGEESSFSNDAHTAGIADINVENAPFNVYSIDGKILKRNAKDLNNLQPGVYIVNNKKIFIK
ncbi:MAG: choice-of-anchor J domain-containing protein [Muribaculaceae bacterium]|nr:choice-of-anchor J domain-containing protein [Muribaculaceae bacterium]